MSFWRVFRCGFLECGILWVFLGGGVLYCFGFVGVIESGVWKELLSDMKKCCRITR